MNYELSKIPLMSIIAIAVIIVGAVKVIGGDLTYEGFLNEVWKFLIGIGVIGGVRVADKVRMFRDGQL